MLEDLVLLTVLLPVVRAARHACNGGTVRFNDQIVAIRIFPGIKD